jgi:radical SAM superfamily enzyme YgiQ (UPF0313 family)
MANVILINPPQLYTITQIASGVVPPIGASFIASYLKRNGHNVRFIDAFGSALDRFSKRGSFDLRGLSPEEVVAMIPDNADVIGITNLFSHAWPVVRDLSQKIKKAFPDVPIVTGGINPTAIPEFVLENGSIDYIVLGEGEQTMLDLVNRIVNGESVEDLDGFAFMRDGKPVINEKTELIEDLDSLPFPAYDMLPIENYIKAMSPHGASRGRWLPLIATRGCPYKCTFCTAEKMWLPRWRSRSVRNVVDEIEHWYKKLNIIDFHFEDLTIVLNKEWAINFCNEIINRGLKISWQMPNGTRSESIDDEVIDKLKASGCTNITFAPESGSKNTLEIVNKKLDLENIILASQRAKKKNMVVCCFFVIGFPHETIENIKETFKFIRKLALIGVDEISITTFTALPGAKLFYRLVDEGKIKLTDEFFRELLYMSDLSWAPSWMEGISDARIARLRRWGYIQFFSISFALRPWRLLRSVVNILRGVEKTKVERVGHEKLTNAIKMLFKSSGKKQIREHGVSSQL